MIKETENVRKIFLGVVQEYFNGVLTSPEFKTKYIEIWKKYRDLDEVYEINLSTDNSIDRIFTVLDCYCEDEALSDEGDLDEKSLRAEVEKILS